MLIGAPFLRTSTDDVIDEGIPRDLSHLGELAGTGTFPVGHDFHWHGGTHWQAQAGEYVRAIADGEVIFAQPGDERPTQVEALREHPLYYYKGWTDNGVVVLKHTTEIGENASVTFYSVYQHLKTLGTIGPAGREQPLKAGDTVYRKDQLGEPGSIYGQPQRIHVEILAAPDQLTTLMGRTTTELTARQGRTNCVWGDIHVIVPAGAPVYAQNPATATTTFVVRSSDTRAMLERLFQAPLERLQALTPPLSGIDVATDTAQDWLSKRTGLHQRVVQQAPPTSAQSTIRVPLLYGTAADAVRRDKDLGGRMPQSYFAPEVARTPLQLLVSLSESRGKVTIATRLTPESKPSPCQEPGEYDLYERSVKAYPGCPSAGYELMRFGRVLGPDQPAASDLHMGRLPHFRPIQYTDAQGVTVSGYLDLNAEGVSVFSDADFPHWDGWTFVDDDAQASTDSRCRSNVLLNLLDPPSPPSPSPHPPTPDQLAQQRAARHARAEAACANAATRQRLRRCVVTMGTEWSSALFEQQWGWLKGKANDPRQVGPANCVSNEVYERFRRHHTALAFWDNANLPLDPKRHVHFHPGEFIAAFKKCGWLSKEEMAQCFPPKLQHLHDTEFEASTTTWKTALACAQEWSVSFNKVARKYTISNSSIRLIHLFSQIFTETGNLQFVKEFSGESQPYSPYYGRGLIQLTHLGNYQAYGKFRNFEKNVREGPYASLGWNPDEVIARNNNQRDVYNCADSACFYVVSKKDMLKHMDAGVDQNNGVTISKDINGYVDVMYINGLDARLQSLVYLRNVLLDAINDASTEVLTFQWRRNSNKEAVLDANGNPIMTGSPPRPKKAFVLGSHTINVSLIKQVP